MMLRIPLVLFLFASLLAPALMEYGWCRSNGWTGKVTYGRIVPEQLYAGVGNAIPAMLLTGLMWRRLGDSRRPVGMRTAMLLFTLAPVAWLVADFDLFDFYWGEYRTGGLICFTGVPIWGALLVVVVERACLLWERSRSVGALMGKSRLSTDEGTENERGQ